MKKILMAILAFCLVCVTGTFMVIGVLGGAFASTCLSSDAAALHGANNRSMIYNYFTNVGLSPEQSVGITASLQHEGGFSPFRQEESRNWPTGGYGIAQFTGAQRAAVTSHMSELLGDDFSRYYNDSYGGAVSAANGFVPEGVPQEVNDKFLSAQLTYLSDYMSTFRPSNIRVRTAGFQALTGLVVPREATLGEYLRSLDSAEDVAIAWTFLYEYPANINSTALDRARSATQLSEEIVELAGSEEGPLRGACGGGTIVSPVADAEVLLVTSGAGWRTRYDGYVGLHGGIDLIGGRDVVAMSAGTVVFAEDFHDEYGSTAVKIDHGNGTYTQYDHLVRGSLEVEAGQNISAGQPLGTMGTSGKSTGIHLHFQLWINDELVNPYPFLVEHGVDLRWSPYAVPINTTPGPL